MAEVFRGRMGGIAGFERMVALKRILPSIAADPDFIEMFVDEAKLAVQLQHANIAQIYELGCVGDSHFIAMEYVSGVDLRTMWDRARGRQRLLPIAMSCHVMQKVCEGLDAAHRKRDERTGEDLRLVHRDVSPQNILVSFEGEVKVIDFGIAKAANKVSRTQAGVLKGKFGYMSPEQVRGFELDNRSDIFACGVVLYELLVGDRLFLGESDFSTLEKIRNVEMLPPTRLNKALSPHLERIVMKALSKDRENRYRWASDMAEDLQRYLFATNQPFARMDLQRYMQQHFRTEMEQEKERLTRYRSVDLPTEAPMPLEPAPVSEPEPSTEVGELSQFPSPAPLLSESAEASPSLPPPPARPSGPSWEPSVGPAPMPFPSGPPSSALPTWAAVVIGVLATLLVFAIGFATLTSQGFFRRPGAIALEFQPTDARVFLDDRLVANGSPVSLEELEPGTHVISVRADGFEEAVRPVAVSAGKTRILSIRLRPREEAAQLEVTSDPPGLEIHLDGRNTGQRTPFQFVDMSVGVHRIEMLRTDGALVHRAELKLEAGGLESLDVDVSSLPTVLEVHSEPSQAEVWLDAQLRGRTPLVLRDLSPGQVRVSVRKTDCKAFRARERLEKSRIHTIRAALRCE